MPIPPFELILSVRIAFLGEEDEGRSAGPAASFAGGESTMAPPAPKLRGSAIVTLQIVRDWL